MVDPNTNFLINFTKKLISSIMTSPIKSIRNIIFLLLFFSFVPGIFSQTQPYVILISFDGFR